MWNTLNLFLFLPRLLWWVMVVSERIFDACFRTLGRWLLFPLSILSYPLIAFCLFVLYGILWVQLSPINPVPYAPDNPRYVYWHDESLPDGLLFSSTLLLKEFVSPPHRETQRIIAALFALSFLIIGLLRRRIAGWMMRLKAPKKNRFALPDLWPDPPARLAKRRHEERKPMPKPPPPPKAKELLPEEPTPAITPPVEIKSKGVAAAQTLDDIAGALPTELQQLIGFNGQNPK